VIRLGISRDDGIRLHFVIEAVAYAAAAAVYLLGRRKAGDVIPDADRLALLASAAVGAALGSRLLAWLCEPSRGLAAVGGGKSIVGALLGGLVAVELVKRLRGVRTPTGDLYVLPLAAGIAIGRVGCFLAGPADRTAGVPADVPWAVVAWDGVPRHPVALYEIAFVVTVAGLLHRSRRRLETRPGLAFALFFASYLAFRLAFDFAKPYPPPVFLGLSAIQLACAAGLVYYALVIPERMRPTPAKAPS
jgi:phosphatidylglycerol---prolipoprotein diacylglyceryl transferase